MPEIINNNYRNKVLNDPVRKWAEGKSDDELRSILGQLEGVQAKQNKQNNIGSAAGYLGDIFLQRGGIQPPSRQTKGNDLNDFIMKETLRQQIRAKPEATIPQGETPPGLWRDPATGKVYKVPIEPVADEVPSTETTLAPKTEKTIPTGAVPEGFWRDPATGKVYKTTTKQKTSAAAEKRAVEESKLSEELGGLLNSFTRAKEESKKAIPKFGASGIQGRLAGVSSGIAGSLGYLPATNVYNKQRKAFATVVAKAAGEVRPTDEDINRFVQTLPDTGKSDEENALLIADIQDKVSKGGLTNLWFNATGKLTPTQTQPQVLSFNSEAEAESANLSTGTIVTINGRKARID